MGSRLTEVFLNLFCEKNSDGTRNLRLKGRELWQRIGKRINSRDMITIAYFLDTNLEIVKVDLCHNNIGDVGIKKLCDHYFYNVENNLQHLNLSSCNITSNGLEYISDVVERLRLKTLRINGNKLGAKGGKVAADILWKCKTLMHLDVGDTELTPDGVYYFLTAIKYLMDPDEIKLRVIDLSRVIPTNLKYQYDPAYLADSFGEILKVNNTLVELHIQKNEFDGHDVELILIGLKKNTSLLLLDVGYNRIGDHGAELIAKWLKTRPPLLGLNIAGNSIKDTGARALSYGLPFSKIRLLDITSNHIGDTGLIDILNSIKKPYMLRVLFIWGNKFSQPTHKVIQRMLASGVLEQEQIDVRLYTVDGVLYAAYYPTNHYKHRYYCVMDHGCPVELKIKRNRVEHELAEPRDLVKFNYYDRVPQVDFSLSPRKPPCWDKLEKDAKK